MFQITTPTGREGPFDSAISRDGYFLVTVAGSDSVLPKSVIGEGVVGPWIGELPGPPAPIPPTPAEFEAALYAHFDKVAQDEGKDQGRPGWENRHTLYARTAFPAGEWYALAASFADWMNTCELLALQLLADVVAGNAPAPATTDAFLATLPAWEKP